MKRLTTLSAATLGCLTLAAFGAPREKTCPASQAASAGWTEKSDIVDTALAAGKFETLAAALRAAELVDALKGDGPFTVFAPTDEAFARIPEADLQSLLKPANRALLTTILTYHVVPGRVAAADVVGMDRATSLNGQRLPISKSDGGVQIAGATIVRTDIECTNGIIHVVDAVLMPATHDVVGTAIEAGSFETLVAAVKAAGLVEALQGEGPFTVFAPSDEAFAALPDGTLESLLEPENKQRLAALLKYHVVPGRVYADQLANGAVKTLEGRSIQVDLSGREPLVNKAHVSAADIEATNGVVHVIDRVLMPE